MAYNTDYLSNLNLEFSDSFGSPISTADLSLFTDANFFDFDVGTDGFEVKSELTAALVELYPEVKQEADLALPPSVALFIPEESEYTSDVDKRKRNTAASARFRVKKRLREQEMEQHSRELAEKVRFLETRVKTLEMENKCLHGLIVERNEKRNDDLVEDIKRRSGL